MVKPYEYQNECLEALAEHRKTNNSALIVMASGLGKTITSALDVRSFIIQQNLSDFRVLYLCHNSFILFGACEEYRKVFGDNFVYESYFGYIHANNELEKADFVFASFQKIVNHLDEFDPEEFDYVVIDEAHHSAAPLFSKVINYFKPKFLLGMTATPERTDTKDILEYFESAVYEKDLPLALAEGLLAKVDYRLMVDDIEALLVKIRDETSFTESELNHEFFLPKRDEEIAKTILAKQAECGAKSIMIFCPSVAHADSFGHYFKDAVIVHSRMPKEDCNARLDAFKRGEVSVIISVDMLNEGVDIPETDMVVFLRSTVSQIIYYQQLGRGLRKGQREKTVVVLDFVANCDRLFMINNLHRKYSQLRPSANCSDEGKELFSLNYITNGFSEVLVNIEQKFRRRKNHWSMTRERLIADLQELAGMLGRTPKRRELTNYPFMACVKLYSDFFGSWNNAVREAGLETTRADRTDSCDRDELILQMKAFAEEIGHVPTTTEVEKAPGLPCKRIVKKVLGPSWREVLENCGFDTGERNWSCYGRKVTDTRIHEALEKYVALSSECVSKDGYAAFATEHDYPCVDSIIRYFGSFEKAMEEYGVSYEVVHYDDDKLLADLVRLAQESGKVPTTKMVDECEFTASSATYKHHFGCLGNAKKLAGII